MNPISASERTWRRLTGPFREFGLATGSIYVLDRVARRVSPRLGIQAYELMAQPVPEKDLLPPGLARKLEICLIPKGHPDIARMPAREDIKQQRFEQGAWCLGVYRADELLGYVWFCSKRYDEDEVRCTYVLDPGSSDVFDFDLYVMPEHRMGIAFSAVWHAAFVHLRARGATTSFSRMTRFNTASRRAHRRLGARCLARAWFICIGPLEIMVSTLLPYVAMTWGGGRVRLRLAMDADGECAARPASSKTGDV